MFRTSSRTASSRSLGSEGRMPPFAGATGWVNSPPLTTDELRGKVVVVEFLTYTCINWLRTLPYVRRWWERYQPHGLTVLGGHTPEFPFEGELENVERAMRDLRVEFPIAVDTNYAVWEAFANNYWPALYFVDAEGRIRDHHFGEGRYDASERVIQKLLKEAGVPDVPDDVSVVEGDGVEAAADWQHLRTGETYLGYERAQNFASPGRSAYDEPAQYTIPERLHDNQWALAGNWTMTSHGATLNERNGRIAFRFHARDVNLIMGATEHAAAVPFRVLLDGQGPGVAHGLDIDSDGNGTVAEPRMYQLIREPERITDRVFEIEFPDGGATANCFTFG